MGPTRSGAPWSTKMGNTASPFRYDILTFVAPWRPKPRWGAVGRLARLSKNILRDIQRMSSNEISTSGRSYLPSAIRTWTIRSGPLACAQEGGPETSSVATVCEYDGIVLDGKIADRDALVLPPTTRAQRI